MSLPGIQVGPGITIGAGIKMGTGASFSLTSADFTTAVFGYGAEGDNTGFSIGGSYGAFGAFYAPQLQVVSGGSLAKANELIAFWANNGLTYQTASYLFDVSWGPGTSTNTARNVAVVLFDYYGDANSTFLRIGAVDTNITGWDTPGQDPLTQISAANGTFLLPATFTLIQPDVQDGNDYC